MTGHCDCCDKNDIELAGVFAGPGPISCAYCIPCAKAGVYPVWALVAYVYTLPWDDISEDFQKVIKRSCEHIGYSLEQFKADCVEANEKLDRYMQQEQAAEEQQRAYGDVSDSLLRRAVGGMKL